MAYPSVVCLLLQKKSLFLIIDGVNILSNIYEEISSYYYAPLCHHIEFKIADHSAFLVCCSWDKPKCRHFFFINFYY